MFMIYLADFFQAEAKGWMQIKEKLRKGCVKVKVSIEKPFTDRLTNEQTDGQTTGNLKSLSRLKIWQQSFD